ncbi:MAG: hypothetical protein HY894_08210 [Deltaproteobacteria bacterium]|nr:hypothetical protein [Deltaproteobacteria bacterium]
MIKAALLGFFCFILFLTLHVVVFRTIELKERFRAMTVIFFSIIPVYVAVYFLVPASYLLVVPMEPLPQIISAETVRLLNAALNFLSGLMLYVFLFLGYCQFYFIVDRSISVRVMIEMERAADKRLSFDEIMRVYSFHGILQRRLEHMVEGEYLVQDGEYYVNTAKGRWEARLFRFLKEFLKLGPGG